MDARGAFILRRAGVGLALFVVFVATLLAGIVLHLDLPPARRALLATVNGTLQSVFLGTLTLESVDHVGLDGVRGLRVSARAPNGQLVLRAQDIEANVSLPTLMASLLLEDGPMCVVLPKARVRYAEVQLDQADSGELLISQAFTPAPSSTPPKAGRGVDFRILDIQLDHVDVHRDGPSGLRASVQVLRGGLRTHPIETIVDVDAASFMAFDPIPFEVSGNMLGQLVVPSKGPLRASTNLDLQLAGVPVRVVAQLHGHHLRGGVKVPETQPEQLHQLLPSLPIAAPVSVEVQVDGTLPKLEAAGRATLADGQATFLVRTDLSDKISANLHAVLVGFVPKSFDQAAPDALVNADISASARSLTSKEPVGDFHINVADTRVAGRPVPPTDVTGTFQGPRVQGALTARSHEGEAAASFTVAPIKTGGVQVVSSLDARFPSFRALQPYSIQLAGSGRIRANATLQLTEAPQVTGNMRADVSQVRFGKVQVSDATLVASLHGPLEAPRIKASLNGVGLRTPEIHVDRFGIKAQGPMRAPTVHLNADVQGAGNVRADTSLSLGHTLSAVDTSVRLGGQHPLRANVRKINIRNSRVSVDGVRLEGLGGLLEAELAMEGGNTRIRAQGDAMRLGRLKAWLPSGAPDVDGLVSLNIDLTASRRHLEGRALVKLTNGSVEGFVRDASANIELLAREKQITLSAKADVDNAARITLEASDIQIDGSPWSKDAWAHAVGDVTLEATANLERVGQMVPEEHWPVRHLKGTASIRTYATRKERGATATVDVKASTTGLGMLVTGDGEPKRVGGMDADVHLFADTNSGHTELRVALERPEGPLISAGLETELDFHDLITHPSRAIDYLTEAWYRGDAVVPRQSIAQLPAILKPSGLSGQVEANVAVEGKLSAPAVHVESKLSGFQFIGVVDPAAVPLDLAIEAQYARSHGQVAARISARGTTVASVTSNLEMTPDVLIGASEDEPWSLSSEVDFHQFPLHTFAPLVGAPLAGHVDGRVRLNDLHRDANLLVSLSSDDLHIGRAVTSKTRLQLAASKGKLTANATLQQGKGQFDIRMRTGVAWGAALIPTFNSKTPVQARVRARTFDLSALGLLPGISELAGTLDADMTLVARPGALAMGKLNGSIELRDGVVNADAVGQRLHGIHALVEVSSGVARLQRLVMRGASGTLTAAATSRLVGLRPVSTRAVVRIPDRDPFPVVFDGIDYGTLAGEVTLAASWREGLKVDAAVPRLRFELAPTPPPNVQKLGPDDAIEVGAVGKDGRFVPLESRRKAGAASSKSASVESPLDVQINVQLGDNVTISRGGSLRANVRGRTSVELGSGRPRIGGSFEISRGTVDIRGRRFKIIEATLSLNEDDPSNPVVSATAEYIASGGYVVTARFTGTIQSGRLTLTSQPSLPENQILNLIAFGSPEGPAAASTSEGRAAAGVVGDEVSQGVNALIGNVTSVDISTRFDTSHEDVRPEVGVQLTEKIAVQLTLVPTQPSPGQSRDRTIVTLEYLFLPRWALETSVGDEGTSVLDLLWRYRY